jgi:alpha-L-fucosidase
MKVFCIPVLCGVLLSYFGIVSSSLVPFPSTTISLSDFLNNQAASIDGTTGNFDKNGSTYVAEYLPRDLGPSMAPR